MRRSSGREQGRVMRSIARRAVQDVQDLGRESGDPGTQINVGTMDGSGNWVGAGILDVTALDAPFLLSEE